MTLGYKLQLYREFVSNIQDWLVDDSDGLVIVDTDVLVSATSVVQVCILFDVDFSFSCKVEKKWLPC